MAETSDLFFHFGVYGAWIFPYWQCESKNEKWRRGERPRACQLQLLIADTYNQHMLRTEPHNTNARNCARHLISHLRASRMHLLIVNWLVPMPAGYGHAPAAALRIPPLVREEERPVLRLRSAFPLL